MMSHMPTNLAIDDRILDEALRVGGHKTKKATVTEALLEYIRRRKQQRIVDLFGKIDFVPNLRLQETASKPVSVLVDTSVWSEALRRVTSRSERSRRSSRDSFRKGTAYIIGPVRQELLSGIRSAEQFATLRDRLRPFPDLPIRLGRLREKPPHSSIDAVDAESKVRNTDFLICAVASQRKLSDLHDRRRLHEVRRPPPDRAPVALSDRRGPRRARIRPRS